MGTRVPDGSKSDTKLERWLVSFLGETILLTPIDEVWRCLKVKKR